MNNHEFVTWLKGFVQSANSYNITPKQWDDLKEQLNKVQQSNTVTIKTTDSNSVSVSSNYITDITYNPENLLISKPITL